MWNFVQQCSTSLSPKESVTLAVNHKRAPRVSWMAELILWKWGKGSMTKFQCVRMRDENLFCIFKLVTSLVWFKNILQLPSCFPSVDHLSQLLVKYHETSSVFCSRLVLCHDCGQIIFCVFPPWEKTCIINYSSISQPPPIFYIWHQWTEASVDLPKHLRTVSDLCSVMKNKAATSKMPKKAPMRQPIRVA